MTLPKLLTVKDVCEASRRGEVRVRNAANSGALIPQPREVGKKFFFIESNVADWINRGSPEMPERSARRRTNQIAASCVTS
ncbi:hypothetical protein [Rhodococcus sp. IEGM 1379]|uniref:hypothetical protein n=1 Tax=Rhodococcus sp. IEGM 1379 TaxID=3047086 RepID=UPI0024B80920|nr:hypothetical protein [Rhodococcus sp. IEGM 1379]MDI9914404.1 hypothetical protein [Rhodococcus sp. IEGM 1379]